MSTKTEIIDIEDEADSNPLKFEEQKAKDMIRRQKRLRWLFHFSLGVFCAVLGMMNKAAGYIIHLIFCGCRGIIYARLICVFGLSAASRQIFRSKL